VRGSQLVERHPLDDLQTLSAKVLRQRHAARREHLKGLLGDSIRLEKSVEVVLPHADPAVLQVGDYSATNPRDSSRTSNTEAGLLAQELESTGRIGNALDVASFGHFSVPFYVLSYALRRHGTRI